MKVRAYTHQREFIQWARDRQYLPLLSETGTGKTYMALNWLEVQKARRVLWLEDPVYTEGVTDDIHALSGFTATILRGTKAHRLAVLQKAPDGIIVTNYETCRTIGPALAAYHFDAVVADESTILKNSRTARFKAAYKYLRDVPLRCIMTGTLVTNSLFDIWAQYLFLDHGQTFGRSFIQFRQRFFYPAGFDWKLKTGAEQQIQTVISMGAYRKLKEDCLNLPPKLFKRFPVKLTSQQQRAYSQLWSDMELELDNGDWFETKYVLAQLAKLLQITSGGLLQDGRLVQTYPSGKIASLRLLLKKLLESHQGVVVWVRYHFEIEQIISMCRRAGIPGVALTAGEDATESVRMFQRESGCRVFITTLSRGSRALTLTKASAVIYYSRDFSVERRIQSEDRTHRIGSERHRVIEYWDLVCSGTVDERTVSDVAVKRLLGRKLIDRKSVRKILSEH